MTRLLSFLVGLFPAPFRRQFGADMVEQIATDHGRARARGRLPAIGFALATAFDLMRSALAERLNPTWIGSPSTMKREGDGMKGSALDWLRDLRLAGRALRRSPGFAVVAIGTLGLAIGANAGIFSVVDTVLLDPLGFEDPDRLVYIAASAPGSDFPEEFAVSAEFVLQYGEQSKLLESVATYNTFTATLRVGDRAERVWMSLPTTSLFATLGVKPIHGRLPVAADDVNVAVISHALWQSWFAGDTAVLGQSFSMAGAPRTVVGIMGPEFHFPDDRPLLWISSVIREEGLVPGRFGMPMIGRLAPGATQEALVSELTALARRLPERFGGPASYARLMELHRPIVRRFDEQLLGGVARPLWVLLGAVGIVLLIACANVANLFLVRAEGRQQELAVRRAIGAGRGQLIRSQMAEAIVVAGLAGIAAVVLAGITVPLFLRSAPPEIPRLADAGITVPTLFFTLFIAMLAALACGLLPAVRGSAPDLRRLRESGRGSTRRRHWGRDALVVAQTAMALVLLIGSGLLVRSFDKLRSVDPGYDTADVFTFQIAPEGDHLPDAVAYAEFHMRFMDRLRALPGVESVGIVENVPLNEGTAGTRFRPEELANDPDAGPLLRFTFAAGDYYQTMGIPVLQGRGFASADYASETGNVVISRSAANMLWPGQDPIGRRLQRQGLDSWETVIGVVEDVMQTNFRLAPEPLVYFPLVGQDPASWTISSPAYVVKTSRAEAIGPEIRRLVHEVAPEAPMYRVFTMAGLARDSMVGLSFTMLTLGIASMLALILGAVGLYGVLSYVVAERTREIGVRMALGAKAAQVRRMVVAQGARVVIFGVALGIAAAIGATRALGSLLFDVEPLDRSTFIGMSGCMIAVGLLASWVPAWRASHVDPIRSLRE